jgi:hypothetical protein
VARLIKKHGDAKLTTLLDTLTGCPKPERRFQRLVQGGLWTDDSMMSLALLHMAKSITLR